jgi:hypothetical protein
LNYNYFSKMNISKITQSLFLIILGFFIAFSCQKKDSTGISPDYKDNSGTGGNPNANNPTVTGATVAANPATQNSSILVGGSGWSNPSCGSTNSLSLKGINGTVDVTVTFATAPITGTYAIGNIATAGICSIKVLNAPNQPTGIVWVGKAGIVSVNTSPTSINATFSGVRCQQESFSLPEVSVNGGVGCSQ